MPEKRLNGSFLKNTLRGVGVWFAVLLILTVITSLFVGRTGINEKLLIYISSALTFISSAAAGNTLRRRKEKMLCCLILSLFLIILALTLGFLLDSSRLESGGILSVVSFTLCGTLCGYVFEIPKKKRSRIKLSS